MDVRFTRQLQILHLSDLHFGEKHRFQPPITASGDRAPDSSYPSLFFSLKQELEQALLANCPTVLCITGDLTETANPKEFESAEKFLNDIHQALPQLQRKNFFIVPGNHDVKFDEERDRHRWSGWADFYNRALQPAVRVDPDAPLDFVALHVRPEMGAAILCLNSAIFVQRETKDTHRGRLDDEQIHKIETELKSASSRADWRGLIKIALVHHHPVLIPELVEGGRGYDAISGGGMLLSKLRKYEFHLILHGHKHLPTTFTQDTRVAFRNSADHVMMICAGGSASSHELPIEKTPTNTFNKIFVKWHPAAQRARIRVETKGLELFDAQGEPVQLRSARWLPLVIDDRVLSNNSEFPTCDGMAERPFDDQEDALAERDRLAIYVRNRGNMPVAHVRPSMLPDHGYEVLLWVVFHPDPTYPERATTLKRVEWKAGKKFPVVSVCRESDSTFSAVFHYWAPALFQARLIFEDDTETLSYVYARIPDNKMNS